MMQHTMYLRRASLFHSLDPRTKLAYMGAMFLASMMYREAGMLFLLLVLNLTVLAFLCRIGVSIVLRRTKAILPILLMSVVLWPFFETSGEVLLSWWIFRVTSGGILMGAAMACRILTIFFATYILLFTTEQKDLVSGLVKLGMGYEYGLTIAIAFRYIPTIASVAETIMDAQKARGLELERGSLFEKTKKYIPILTPLIVASIKMSAELAIAIESRAFGRGERTSLREPRFCGRDWITLCLLVLCLASLTVERLL